MKPLSETTARLAQERELPLGLDALGNDIEFECASDVYDGQGEQGVTGYDQSTCWHDYRLGMIQVPLISALGCAFAIESERGDDMMAAMLRRGCRAIRDLGTLELIESE